MILLASLKARIFWSLIPIFCVIFVVLGIVDFYQQKQLADEEITRRGQAMADNLAYSSRLAVLTEDKPLLDAALTSITGAADFAYVWIYGEKWIPLAKAGARQVELNKVKPEIVPEQRNRLIKSEMLFNRVYHDNQSYIEFIVPITSRESSIPYELQIDPSEVRAGREQFQRKTIGAVRLGLSMTRLDSHVTSFLKWRGWSLAVFLSLSVLAIYFVSGRITQPINRLTEQAHKMSQGFLDEAIPINSCNEVGQLATAFNNMASTLKDHYLSLERKVADRTKELTLVNEKLAEASEHKSRFLANVNHELRTPLSSIIGYGRLLRRETEGQISSLQRENLADLLRNAERLLAMIDSLLDFAKIESGKIDLSVEAVRVDELFQNAVATIEPMLNKNKVRLVRDVPEGIPPLYTDPEKLRQILLNLLGNAAKFTDQGEIRVSAQRENGHFEFSVADTGIGIDPADVNRIFEEFDRGRLAVAGPYHGTGLGLAIVKRLVDVLGGAIRVESETGKGSTFSVSLPVHETKDRFGTDGRV